MTLKHNNSNFKTIGNILIASKHLSGHSTDIFCRFNWHNKSNLWLYIVQSKIVQNSSEWHTAEVLRSSDVSLPTSLMMQKLKPHFRAAWLHYWVGVMWDFRWKIADATQYQVQCRIAAVLRCPWIRKVIPGTWQGGLGKWSDAIPQPGLCHRHYIHFCRNLEHFTLSQNQCRASFERWFCSFLFRRRHYYEWITQFLVKITEMNKSRINTVLHRVVILFRHLTLIATVIYEDEWRKLLSTEFLSPNRQR